MGLQGGTEVTRGSERLLRFKRGYRGLPGVTRGYRGLQGVKER